MLRHTLTCPLNKKVMSKPVVAADGNSYQAEAFEAWVVRVAKL